MGRTGAARKPAAERGGRDEEPRRKNYRLHQSKLDAAREALGTKTETETIERALDLAAFGERLASGTERIRGLPWNDIFGEMAPRGPGAEE
ncbi:MAG TPA: hypothetical protein VHG28_04000 [Longimicrobiaceae bacterium]|nr:hypothetical protein [Longimicrobiaceae bacterium]